MPNFANFEQIKNFAQKLGVYQILTSCLKSEKGNEQIVKKNVLQTNGHKLKSLT